VVNVVINTGIANILVVPEFYEKELHRLIIVHLNTFAVKAATKGREKARTQQE
jgi:hypothetical protein